MKIMSISNTPSREASSKGLVNVILENGEKALLKDMPLDVIEDFKNRLDFETGVLITKPKDL